MYADTCVPCLKNSPFDRAIGRLHEANSRRVTLNPFSKLRCSFPFVGSHSFSNQFTRLLQHIHLIILAFSLDYS
jgi:hypothetical protein